ncbi:hypothetical protein [Methylotenera sp.]|uniref:hypothetical protein n=1 Tax=Methylotenera sp. TaxID=2051956 RepID=UPI00248A11F8|nr:hypothetical protein [Methylotenera sp.]MDI1298631.1 hypothetical protein [Methylotenera sp.]
MKKKSLTKVKWVVCHPNKSASEQLYHYLLLAGLDVVRFCNLDDLLDALVENPNTYYVNILGLFTDETTTSDALRQFQFLAPLDNSYARFIVYADKMSMGCELKEDISSNLAYAQIDETNDPLVFFKELAKILNLSSGVADTWYGKYRQSQDNRMSNIVKFNKK